MRAISEADTALDRAIRDGAWIVRDPDVAHKVIYIVVASNRRRYDHAFAQVRDLWDRRWREQIGLNC